MKLEIKNLSFSYGNRKILDDISFSLRDGEFLSVLGENGAGKSTIFKCILKLVNGYTGEISIDGQGTEKFNASQMASNIAYIPQSSASVFNYSVNDIVLMGTTAGCAFYKIPGMEEEQRAEDALRKLDILDYRDRCFHQLSGGEKQLVIIARALAQQAKILLFDEPTSALDFGNQMLVLNRMKKLSEEGYSVMQTTHNPEHAYIFSDTIVAIKDGKILKYGNPSEIIEKDTLTSLYNINMDIESFDDDRIRICVPVL